MAITNSFREAVSNGNIKSIRIMMKDSLLVDPTFVEFSEMSLLASSVIGLYDQHDKRELQSDISTWDDNYMDKLMVQVVSNFSKERLEHLKAVVNHLRPVTARSQPQSTTLQPSSSTPIDSHQRPITQQARHSNYQEQKRHDQRNGNFRGMKTVAGAIIGGTIAGVAAGSVIIGVAASVIVVGTAAAITRNGGQNNE